MICTFLYISPNTYPFIFLPQFLPMVTRPIPIPLFHNHVVSNLPPCTCTPRHRPYHVHRFRILTSNFTSFPASPNALDFPLLFFTRSLFFRPFPRLYSSNTCYSHGHINFIFNFKTAHCSRRVSASVRNGCHQTFNHGRYSIISHGVSHS